MSEPRERVARAIAARYVKWDNLGEKRRDVYRRDADAALSALEPAPAPTVAEAAKNLTVTDDMCERGAKALAAEYERGSAPSLEAFVARVDSTWGRYMNEVRVVLEASLSADTEGR